MSDRPNTDPPTKADVAATIDDYDTPLLLAALASPYALNAITDMDVHAADLVDEGTTLYDAANREFVQSRLGGPASSLSAYPLATGDLDDDVVTAAKVAVDAVANEHLQADAVDSAELATDAVTAAKVAVDAVANEHLANDAVNSAELATDAVQAAHIAASAVGSGQLATNAVTTGALAADAVTGSEIAADAVGSAHIAPDSVGNNQLAFDVATQSEFDSHALDADAHHNRPTSTQSASSSTGYDDGAAWTYDQQVNGDKTFAIDFHTAGDGVKIEHLVGQYGYIDESRVYLDGSLVDTHSGYSSPTASYETTFQSGTITRVEIDFSGGYSGSYRQRFVVTPRKYAVGPHSHSV
ncbi:hypothetical protein [Halocalculus aciditolerans]|uniref:Uncharacterized protein n=1 Tax=Halocalculus aciditolerans TaxID=1383812 RepID=A0A830F337_9EURY|nr:hypothetical protein [Halocalculus aciditolerans]GGL57952.1 hypothetical protein GCM10009039_15190 [Halocalculus aciditolerans]